MQLTTYDLEKNKMATDLSHLTKGLTANCDMSNGNTISDGTTGAPGSDSVSGVDPRVVESHIPDVTETPVSDHRPLEH